jgi:ferritin
MLSQKVQDALNDQTNCELTSSYAYLAMSAYCERQNFRGSAHWLMVQSQEEYQHAMKLYNFMLARNCKVVLTAIPAPRVEFDSIPDVFERVLEQETDVTRRIESLYELAFNERAFAELVELQWFISEQVEEERTAREIIGKIRLVKDEMSAMLDLDRELGSRTAEAAPPNVT